jgi:hypothetical protein
MAIFGFGKDKEDPADPGLVLACLEEALRLRSPFRFGDGRRETSALVHSVNEETRSFRLLPKDDLALAKGGKVAFTFIHEGLRLGGDGRLLEARPGIVALQLPVSLAVMERRAGPRARLNPKERATFTALQDLFQGVGITGALENIGEGGAKVRVDKAVAIGSDKRLVLGLNLVPPCQRFLVVKLNKVPRCPAVMEAEGRAVHLGHEGGALMPKGVLRGRVKWVLGRGPGAMESAGPGRYCLVGVEFMDTPEAVARDIEAYVTQRLPG